MLVDHEAQLGRVLALAAVAQEGFEALAQVFGRRRGSPLQERLSDVRAADVDLFQPRQRLLNSGDKLGRHRIRQGIGRYEAIDEAAGSWLQEVEVLLDDRIVEVVEQGLRPPVDQPVEFVVELLQDVRSRKHVPLLVRRPEAAVRADGAGRQFRFKKRCAAFELVQLLFKGRERDCHDFRVWAGIMGKKESPYVPTQRTRYT